MLELPDGTDGYSLYSITTTPVSGEAAVDVSITLANSDITQPEVLRTVRLMGLTEFDADSIMMIQVEPPIPLPEPPMPPAPTPTPVAATV